MIRDDSYVVIPGWVLNKLQLKGNMLLIYSIIYGFCQDRESNYHGSIAYLAEWTQSTRQSVSGCLAQLCEMGLIRKEKGYPNNKYYIVFADDPTKNTKKDDTEECKESLQERKDTLHQCKESLHACKDSLHNNIEYISNNTKEDNIEAHALDTSKVIDTLDNKVHINRYAQNKNNAEILGRVVGHFNEVCGTAYRNSKGLQKVIYSKLKEGFTENDFIKIIDYKYNEWGINPRRLSSGDTTVSLLRPSILFGDKMDEYLQQANKTTTVTRCSNEFGIVSEKRDPSKVLDIVY